MTTLAKYIVALEAQSAQYVAELQKANNELKKFHDDQTKSIDGIKSAFRELGLTISAGLFVNFVKSTLEANTHLYELAQRLGTTTEYLSAMRFAVKQNGAEFESFTSSLQTMERQIGLAASGISTRASAAFKDLNLSVQQLAKDTPEVAYARIVQRLSEVTDQSKRAADAGRIFGDSMIAVQFAAQGGAEALDLAKKKAEEFGVVISTEGAKASKEATDAINDLKEAMEGLSNVVIVKVIGGLHGFADALRKNILGGDQIETLNDQLAESETRLKAMQDLLKKLYEKQTAGETRSWFGSFQPAIDKLIASVTEAHKQIDLLKAARDRLAGALDPNKAYRDMVIPGLNQGPDMGRTFTPDWIKKPGTNPAYQQFGSQNIFGNASQMIDTGLRLDKEKQEQLEYTKFYKDQVLERQRADIDAWDVQMKTEKEGQIEIMKLAKDMASQELGFRQDLVSNIGELFSVMGEQHRGFAIVAIGIQKALAIQQTLINGQAAASQIIAWSHVAAMAAIATDPTPVGYAQAAILIARGVADAAMIRGLSIASAAVIGATGLVEALQVSHGGSSSSSSTSGSAANPINTTGGVGGTSVTGSAAAQQKSAVSIIFQGDVFGWDDTMRKRIVDSLRDLIDNKDVIIIGPNSRQAQILPVRP